MSTLEGYVHFSLCWCDQIGRFFALRNADEVVDCVVGTAGVALAGLASGSFIVELFFGIPGVGLLAIESLFARDYPIIMAVVLIGTTLFVMANLLVDLAYPLLDPRIRLGGSSFGG